MRRRLARAVLRLVAGSALAWLGAFAALVSDASLLGPYLRWSWTGGGELIAFVQLAGTAAGALGATVGLVVGRSPRLAS